MYCRVCLDNNIKLLDICNCTDPICESCFNQWIAVSSRNSCEICTSFYKVSICNKILNFIFLCNKEIDDSFKFL